MYSLDHRIITWLTLMMRKNDKNKTEMISDIYMYFEPLFIMKLCLLILTSGKKDKILFCLESEFTLVVCLVYGVRRLSERVVSVQNQIQSLGSTVERVCFHF